MARTDNDTWDLATSVGATATGVAVGRALASRATNPLINDPFAEPLVRAVGVGGCHRSHRVACSSRAFATPPTMSRRRHSPR
jgi:O-methyltransferase involved in polyketide biosynthesis